jgi:hypothetical protein
MVTFRSSLLNKIAMLSVWTTISSAGASHNLATTPIDDIITWVRSKGGFFSDSIEIRRIDPSDETSYFGVFAKRNIKANDELMKIPHECYIESWDEARTMGVAIPQDYDTLDRDGFNTNACLLSNKLEAEMKLDNDSSYAPYVAYLKTQNTGQVPAMWSANGKDVLRMILESGNDAVDWMDLYFLENGSSSCIVSDPFEMHMMEMSIQRGFDNALIPLWDMVNHDSGPGINTETNSLYDTEEGGVKVKALVDIKAGEELFHSYIDTFDNNQLYKEWGTTDILKNFGFVEGYPHRWVNYENEVWFEILEDANGELRVSWPDDKTHGQYFVEPEWSEDNDDSDEDDDDIDRWWDEMEEAPTEKCFWFLQDELRRLKNVEVQLKNNLNVHVATHEWDTTMNYLQAKIHDYSLALVAASKLYDEEKDGNRMNRTEARYTWNKRMNYHGGTRLYQLSSAL